MDEYSILIKSSRSQPKNTKKKNKKKQKKNGISEVKLKIFQELIPSYENTNKMIGAMFLPK